MAINGQTAATIVHNDDYTGYVSPYFVISKGKFTKHYFEGAGRIVSKLGNGTFAQPLGITAGGVNYTKLTAEQQKAMDTYVRSLGVPPGPPTQQGIYATPEFTGDAYPSEVIKPVEENQEPPEGWPRNPIFNAPGDVPGQPVQFGPPIEPTTVIAGEGFTGIGLPENDIFYFHPDHLGSTSYITNKNGSISQHVEYIAFGEVLFEEHSSSFSSPYLFNGKELDRETNLSYFGARYYDSKTSLWLNVDPLSEKYPSWSPYNYCFNSPVKLIDPDGMGPKPAWLLRVLKGQSAHRALTQYLQRIDPAEKTWRANKAINAPDDLLRPDVVYDNGVRAGVWELKPAPPAFTSAFAAPEAKMYANRLNKSKDTERFKTGTSGKAPSPFIGEITVTDADTGNQFLLTIPDSENGAIFWTEITKYFSPL